MGTRAITVCVGYDDFLRLTLPRIIKHVDKLLIVTTPDDVRTQQLAAEYPKKTALHTTDAFYRGGASFNKGLAMEEGFDVLGRKGWILVLDADILLPEKLPQFPVNEGKLYTPRRRIMTDVDGLTETPTVDPATLPIRKEYGNFGYFQLFHADDPVLVRKPWYGTDWLHAGGCDSVFEKRWNKANKVSPPFEVIHLGDPDANWFGRTRPRIDTGEIPPDAAARLEKQNALHRKYGWKGFAKTGEPLQERFNSSPHIVEDCHKQAKPGKKPTGKRFRRG
jgi:hypothetical protein